MEHKPTLVLIPGAWHKPQCYHKLTKSFQNEHGFKCTSVDLPSTRGDPNATYKDDIEAARDAITAEIAAGRNVIVIAHSYGGMIGNSSIKGLTRPQSSTSNGTTGHVLALVLIASGFTITGLAFMDPLFGHPPPFWRVNKGTGFAELIADELELFYHDLPQEEGEYWVGQLTTQSLKALFEGGEHSYAGWKDVPTWYIGTTEDRGLPVVIQRLQVGAARGQGGVIHHMELPASHSPFLSMPDEVKSIILHAVEEVGGLKSQDKRGIVDLKKYEDPRVRLFAPRSWLRFGIPFAVGHVIGWGFFAYYKLRKLFTG